MPEVARFFITSLLLILLLALPAMAENDFGPRIPTAYFVTTGVGQSDEGIPPEPYETFSYDLALLEAGIENFNVVFYTSVLPKESYEIPLEEAKKYFHHGSVLETIMARAGGKRGDTVAAGVGRVWAKNAAGESIGGFAAEYERVYEGQKISANKAKAEAEAQLTRSLQHELSIRGLQRDGEMTFATTSLQIEKNYGMALSALGFVNFISPPPYPVQKP